MVPKDKPGPWSHFCWVGRWLQGDQGPSFSPILVIPLLTPELLARVAQCPPHVQAPGRGRLGWTKQAPGRWSRGQDSPGRREAGPGLAAAGPGGATGLAPEPSCLSPQPTGGSWAAGLPRTQEGAWEGLAGVGRALGAAQEAGSVRRGGRRLSRSELARPRPCRGHRQPRSCRTCKCTARSPRAACPAGAPTPHTVATHSARVSGFLPCFQS